MMVSVHGVEGGVTAGGDQGDERRLECWVGQVSGGDVTLEVVHADQRDPGREGEFVRRAAAGTSHVLYAFSPGGAEASAIRTARRRPQILRAASRAGRGAPAVGA